jgi:hypothetical protein
MTELQIRAERFCLGLLPLLQDLHRKFGGDLVHSPITKDPVEQREIALQYIDDSRPYLASTLEIMGELGPPSEEVRPQQEKLTAFLISLDAELAAMRVTFTEPSDVVDIRQAERLILQRIAEVRAEPDLAEALASHFGSKLNCSKMGLEYNYVHVTGG